MSCGCGCSDTGAQTCGCCTGVAQLTPQAISNRSVLPAISYRVGVYATFLASMEAALSSSLVPALAGLRTRSSGDFSMALIDAWSEVLDILTFYTERLANEAYLGTAIEARSVFELARLVGYKPSPGVSASTVLAFTLATATGSPTIVPIPAGTRVQSVPGPGQSPQVFETSTALTATIANNAIPVATSQPSQATATAIPSDTPPPIQLPTNANSTWLAGISTGVKVGDALLIVAASSGTPTTSSAAALVFVTAVTVNATSGNTQVSWDENLPSSLTGTPVFVYSFGSKAALFGAAAPWPGLFYQGGQGSLQYIPGAPTITVTNGQPQSPFPDWAWIYNGSQTIQLDNSYPGLNPAPSANAAQLEWMVLTGNGNTAIFLIESASDLSPAWYTLSSKSTAVKASSGAVIQGSYSSTDLDTLLSDFVTNQTRQTTVYVQSQLLAGANLPNTAWPAGSTSYTTTSGMLTPVFGSSIVLQGLQPLAEGAPVAVSGNRVRIVATSAVASPKGGFTPTGATGALAVGAGQPFLVDAYPPIDDPDITGNLLWTVLTVTGQSGTLSIPSSSVLLQPAATTQATGGPDPIAGEAVIISTVEVSGGTTTLTLSAPLTRIYDAATLTVNANAIEATHGETMMEIMGSGDATNPALQFQLKQSPLTYTSAATTSGIQSTLQVRVNNVLWTEVSNFLSSAPGDRVYVTRPNSGAGPTVQFGDGVEGSRTQTGVSNIQAKYRKGIGIAGMVAAGQLTQPLDRPQGLQNVTNPSAATGGADPASPADAQQSAPLPTLTMGRVVSLEDYQNFALNFAGISMALATWTWFGNVRGILITLAGEGGTTLESTDQVVVNLMAAYQQYGLPTVPVQPVSYQPQNFEVAMQVMVDTPTYDPAVVIPQVWQALTAAFAFGQLAPGQSVAASQIVSIAQQITGVIAVNLTGFGLQGDASGTVENLICAAGPVAGSAANGTQAAGAQVLLLDPACEGNVVLWPTNVGVSQ